MGLFKKIYIKSENDLPKDSGVFFVGKRDFEKGLFYFNPEGKGKAHEYDITYWMDFVEWYLQPIEPDEMQTPIEDGLYSTGRFTQDECSELAEGLIRYINDYLK